MRRAALGLVLAVIATSAFGQTPFPAGPANQSNLVLIAPTPPTSDNGDRIANTAWVNLWAGSAMPLATGKIWIGSAGGIATAQTPTGDLAVSNAGVFTLNTVNGSPGGYGTATTVPNFTVNAKGLITSIAGITITPAVGSITGLGTGVATALGNAANASGGFIGPTPTRAGDVAYWNGSTWVSLAGNNSGTNCFSENSSGVPSWASCTGIPGGSNTQVQYNNSGAFGGVTGATTNGTTLTLVAPILGTPASVTLTNGTGLPIAGITGLGTGVGTALGVNVGTAGAPVVNGGALGSPSSAGTMPSFTNGGTITGGAYASVTGLGLVSAATINWNSDTFAGRFAAANFRHGQADAASPVAQTLSVQGVVAGTSNTAGVNWTFAGSQGTGTGVGGAINFQVAPAGLTGTAQNPLVTALAISGTSSVGVGTTTTTSAKFTVEDGSGNNQLDLRYTGKVGFLGQQLSNGNFSWNLADNAALTMAANNGSGGTVVLEASGGTSIGTTPFDPGLNNLYVQGAISTAPPTTQSGATYTMGVSDSLIIFNSSATVTLTTLSAATYKGRWLHLKTTAAFAINSAASNVVPLAGGAAGTAILAATAGKWADLQSDGTNWIITAAN